MNNQEELFERCVEKDLEKEISLLEQKDGPYDINMGTLANGCRKGNTKAVKFLIEEIKLFLNPNEKDGLLCLLAAISNGHEEIVEILVRNGANIDLADILGWTPLIFAAYYRHIDIVRFLIEQGADVEVKDIQGRTFIQYLNKRDQEMIGNFIEDLEYRKAMIKPNRK